ncbi:MAG: hypothetical protein ACI8UP_001818, partial [Porticoccaceae bacterium]
SHVFDFFEFRKAIDSEWRNWVTGRFNTNQGRTSVRTPTRPMRTILS